MKLNILRTNPAERLLSLILLNERVREGYVINKKRETEATVIQIIRRSGNGNEKYKS